MRAPIAVVAAACEFPDAATPQALWQLALHGRQCFRRLPPERMPLADYLRDDGAADGLYPIEAALLEAYEFDRHRFVVPQSSYRATDMAHWLALDVADRALAQLPSDWAGDQALKDRFAVIVANTLTGEFSRANLLRYRWPYIERCAREAAAGRLDAAALSAFVGDFESSFKRPFPAPDEDSLAGALSNTIAGRISNHFGLRGGAHAVDGACASSLVAVISACERLQAGAVDAVVVAAVDLSLDPFELVGFARNGALARGAMRVFDRDSNGFWPGEGCGCLVLASGALARRRQWPVLGWIRGVGMSTDGQGGLTRPTQAGQCLALRRAWADAALDPALADYFEAHGTGTATGDPVELAALAQCVAHTAPGSGSIAPGRGPVAVGSIKANIGHTKAAAGMAGMLKALAVTGQRVIPATTGCVNPHAVLDQAEIKATLRIPRAAEAISHDQAVLVGINSFGFGGVNCHVVLQGPQPHEKTPGRSQVFTSPAGGLTRSGRFGGALRRHRRSAVVLGLPAFIEGQLPGEWIALQAASQAELRSQVDRLCARATTLSRAELGDLAAACQPGASQAAAWRASVVADSPQALESACAALQISLGAGGKPRRVIGPRWSWSAPAPRPPRLAFVFPGQGLRMALCGQAWSQRFGFLAGALARVAALTTPSAPGAAGTAPAIDTALAQPLLAETSLAALELLAHFGLRPQGLLGHSFGEIVALHAAGVMNAEALRELARWRGRAMQEDAVSAAMLAIEAEPDQALALAGQHGVEVACYNAPRRQVLAGPTSLIDTLAEHCARAGIAAHRLPTDRAFHSRLMQAAAQRFAADLVALPLARPTLPVLSSITGDWLTDEPLAELLVAQFERPVRFAQALGALDGRGPFDLVIELCCGSGTGLSPLLAEAAGPRCLPISAFSDSLQPLLAVLGAAWVCGAEVNTEALYTGRLLRPLRFEIAPRFLASPCGAAAAAGLPGRADTALATPAAPSEPSTPIAAGAAGRPALETLRAVVCALAELSPGSLGIDSRLLADLHLNSIRARHAVALAARQLGIATLPLHAVDVATASLGDIALALEALRAGQAVGEAAVAAAPAGIAPWIRLMAHGWWPAPWPDPAEPSTRTGAMRLDDSLLAISPELRHAAAGMLAEGVAPLLLQATPAVHAPPPTLLILPAAPDSAALARLLAQARGLAGDDAAAGLLVLQGGQWANAFLRSVSAELPHKRICVVEYEALDIAALRRGLQAYHQQAWGYCELRLRGAIVLQRQLQLQRLAPAPGQWLPGADDLVLITGGAKGLGAATALWLGRRYRCRLALVGRSSAEQPEVAASLAALRTAGLSCQYLSADLGDPRAAAEVLAQITQTSGAVTALIHAAGINRPSALRDLDLAELQATLSAKVDSLVNLLEAMRASGAAPPHLLVGFGSIIGELGLAGEAHYALANEGLVAAMQAAANTWPSMRCLPICWSAWRETGMANRLEGVLDSLARADTRALDSAEALDMLGRLLESDHQGQPLIVCGRHGRVTDPVHELPALHAHRYLDWPRVYYPGIELVADAELSLDSDPHLRDHAPYGLPVFPLVSAIEAMVSAAQCVQGRTALPLVSALRIGQAITCAADQRLVLRTLALVQDDGAVRVAIRCSSSDFAADHFSALMQWGTELASAAGSGIGANAPFDATAPAIPARPVLYQGLVFHGPSLQRIGHYHAITAQGCLARNLRAEPPRWYGPLLPPRFTAGEPALRDAVLHALQACIPQHPVLPIAAESIELGVLRADREYLIDARQTWGDGQEFSFDIEVRTPAGERIERWRGLRVSRLVSDHGDPGLRRELDPALLQAYAGRLLLDSLGDAAGRVGVSQHSAGEGLSPVALSPVSPSPVSPSRASQSRAALSLALGRPVDIEHDRHGAPRISWASATVARGPASTTHGMHGEEAAPPNVSLSHADGLTLAAAHPGQAIACDIQALPQHDPASWRLMLGEQHWAFARDLAAATGLQPPAACLITWCAAECLFKLGRRDWPFELHSAHRSDAPHTGPVLTLVAPALRVVVGLLRLRGQAAELAVALALAPMTMASARGQIADAKAGAVPDAVAAAMATTETVPGRRTSVLASADPAPSHR